MSHYSKQEWKSYISGSMQRDDAEKLEQHLYACDLCLQQYMDSAMQHSDVPEWQGQDAVMSKVHGKIGDDAITADKPYHPFRKLLLPYAVAASITLLLMGTGVFDMLMQTEELYTNPDLTMQESYSEKAVRAVSGWLDEVLHNPKGGSS